MRKREREREQYEKEREREQYEKERERERERDREKKRRKREILREPNCTYITIRVVTKANEESPLLKFFVAYYTLAKREKQKMEILNDPSTLAIEKQRKEENEKR